ncbi:type II secretion system minor pseudopilin GspJ [Dasania sp. GY-MA-18]|uniref:Type II secretion system protein J n=1 Tax=Dasania phycosphaerae TaxID=2950436 RepID=A0A9J6RID9_9GAMM|nr:MULTISPECIES: type II secretion system minor pseudopilin GspJ [Dasania]MCR8921799.1 type II secretion system minor pseudopilin GspJ [Dasania sp. GY-MA-18]MCZ0864227.1 type II secretion system minor pseudopilin GspJ [Dasania phycosphaerae]MCZ0867955.1 type II secretion system minor pseudopilin GspJ [Dasania phycosphaerae]
MRARLKLGQQGLTLIEVLIALSIFALIGLGSGRLLSTVISSQQINQEHSQQLASLQRSMSVIDRDLQFFADRPIRAGADQLASLVLAEDYSLELTRAGWRNPLMLERSQLQRVAYDVGYHPQRDDASSPHYQSNVRYLRRHYWPHLDRVERSQSPITQLLMANVIAFDAQAISDQGSHKQWPIKLNSQSQDVPELKGLAMSITLKDTALLSRVYRFN